MGIMTKPPLHKYKWFCGHRSGYIEASNIVKAAQKAVEKYYKEVGYINPSITKVDIIVKRLDL